MLGSPFFELDFIHQVSRSCVYAGTASRQSNFSIMNRRHLVNKLLIFDKRVQGPLKSLKLAFTETYFDGQERTENVY